MNRRINDDYTRVKDWSTMKNHLNSHVTAIMAVKMDIHGWLYINWVSAGGVLLLIIDNESTQMAVIYLMPLSVRKSEIEVNGLYWVD